MRLITTINFDKQDGMTNIKKQLSEVIYKLASEYNESVSFDSDDVKHLVLNLIPYKKDLIDLYEKELTLEDNDLRSGEETYGYESPDSIVHSFIYISDRWCASFRVRWLINLIDPSYNKI